jgi:hypothetical protein
MTFLKRVIGVIDENLIDENRLAEFRGGGDLKRWRHLQT